MKRDMDFVREILLEIEGGEVSFDVDLLAAEDDEAMDATRKRKHHLNIMRDAGLIEVVSNGSTTIHVSGLTWKGHDFLDTIRDAALWRKTKEGASKAGGAGFSFIVELGKAYAKSELQKLGLPLG